MWNLCHVSGAFPNHGTIRLRVVTLTRARKKKNSLMLLLYLDHELDLNMGVLSYESLKLEVETMRKFPLLSGDPDYKRCFFGEPCEELIASRPCNGLFCVVDMDHEFLLLNPGTGQHRRLPRPPYQFYDVEFGAIGLGFDSIKNDYKIITFLGDQLVSGPDGCKVAVFDLSSNSWREIHYGDKGNFPLFDSSKLCISQFNNSLHWITHDKIISFDLSAETFSYIELPHDVAGNIEIEKSLIVVDGCLALFAYAEAELGKNWEREFLDIWVMKEYGVAESWTKRNSIRPTIGMYHPLLVWKNEAVLVRVVNRGLGILRLDGNTVTEIEIDDVIAKNYPWPVMSLMAYHETSVSITP